MAISPAPPAAPMSATKWPRNSSSVVRSILLLPVLPFRRMPVMTARVDRRSVNDLARAFSALTPSVRERVKVLGPLRLVVDGGAVEVPGPKRRAVLALLALAEGRPVPVDRLVDALWPTEMPDSARQALHTHVSRLRAHLGVAATRLQTRLDGYRLDLDPADLDVTQARGLLATARTRAPRDPAGALPLLREAHALWRGPVLGDLTDVEAIATAVEGWAQLHRNI